MPAACFLVDFQSGQAYEADIDSIQALSNPLSVRILKSNAGDSCQDLDPHRRQTHANNVVALQEQFRAQFTGVLKPKSPSACIVRSALSASAAIQTSRSC